MFTEERQNLILQILKKNGAVTTSRLVSEFGVSMETIRRDLLNMERQHLLKRVHGGAVTIGEMKEVLSLSARTHELEKEKRQLSLAAVELVEENDIIGIDAGSTAYFFAEALKERFRHLTVVTYSMDVFLLLQDTDFDIILCGGNYLKSENCFYGPLALDAFKKLYIKKSFVFPSAVSLQHGICIYSTEIYILLQNMMQSSEQVYILADSSKFEKQAMLCLDEMKKEYIYVTDCCLSAELKQLYKENGLEFIY